MSVQAMARVWELDLPHAERLVLLALADHADHVGDNIYPSIGLIAWKTGYSSRQVQRIIKSLVEMQILCVVDVPEGRTTVYRMDLKAGTVKEPYPRQNVRGDKMSGVTKRPPPTRQNVTPTPDIAMSPEPSVKPSRTISGGEAASERETAAAVGYEKQAALIEGVRLLEIFGFSTRQARECAAKIPVTSDLMERAETWRLMVKGRCNPVSTLYNRMKIGLLPNDFPPPPEPVLSDDERMRQYLAEFNSTPVSHATYRGR